MIFNPTDLVIGMVNMTDGSTYLSVLQKMRGRYPLISQLSPNTHKNPSSVYVNEGLLNPMIFAYDSAAVPSWLSFNWLGSVELIFIKA